MKKTVKKIRDDVKVSEDANANQTQDQDSDDEKTTTADKVFITTVEDTVSYLEVSDSFDASGDTNYDAVIYSKSDLVLNGLGTLQVLSKKGNGITSRDDLKITGGSYAVDAAYDAFEANDSIRIYDGDFYVTTQKVAFHSENEEDVLLGYIYFYGGSWKKNQTKSRRGLESPILCL